MKRLFLGLAVLCFGVLPACTGEQSTTDLVASSDEKVLLRGNSGEPGTLDPHLVRSAPEFIIVNDLFVGLFSQAMDGEVIPGAAESHEVSGDGLTWTFTLRDDLKWSDETPITSEDFLYSMQRALMPETASPNASLLFAIKNAASVNASRAPVGDLGVRAPDAKTVIFELERPTPYFDRLLLSAIAMPVPRHIIEAHGQQWARPPHAVSNGAFKINDWQPRVHVETERNAAFYDADNVRLEGVRYVPTEDLSTQLKRFRAGEIDIGLNFPPSQADWVKRNLSDSIRIFPIYGTYYYPFNLSSPKFQDRRVRKALNIAIDRETIVERLLGSGEQAAYSFVPPGFENYPQQTLPDFASQPLSDRQAEARQLLQDAGYTEESPLEVEIRYNMTEEHQAIAVAVSNMWNAIGVESKLLSTETRTHYRDLALGEFEIGRTAMFANYADPHAFLMAFSTQNRADNFSGYDNPQFETALAASSEAETAEERGRLMGDAEQIALDDYPIVPLYFYVSKRLVNPRVRGWENNPVGTHLSRYMWLEDTE